MKKKIVACVLATILCISMPLTTFASESPNPSDGVDQVTGTESPSPDDGADKVTGAESPKPSDDADEAETSSSSDETQESSSSSTTATTSTSTSTSSVATDVASARPGQAVAAKSITVAIASADGKVSAVSLDTVISTATTTIIAAATNPENAVATIESLLTSAVTPQFTATVRALAEIKGSDMVVNNMGTIKTSAVAKDAFGNTIASAGVVKNVTSGSLILLMSVNADGTVEYVEGVVDPVTGAVLGAFQGTPSVITVLVLA
jgi:hypothetical protein